MNLTSFFNFNKGNGFLNFPFSLTSAKKQEDHVYFVDYLKELPFDKRVNFLMKKDLYLILVKSVGEEVLRLTREKQKEEGEKGPLPPEVEKEILEFNIQSFFHHFFTDAETDNVFKKLYDEKSTLSKSDRQFLLIHTKLLQQTSLSQKFNYTTLLPFLEKGVSECSDLIGQSLLGNPKKVLGYGVFCMKHGKNNILKSKVDGWVTKWLNKKALIPLYSEDNFQDLLLKYFENTPPQTHDVLDSILSQIQRMPESLQTKIWDYLFLKTEKNPQGINTLKESISRFWQQSNSEKEQTAFYQSFSKLPKDTQSQILSRLPAKILKKYWNAIYPKDKEILSDTIQTENGENFLGWHLFQQGDIKSDQMIQILEQLDLKKNEAFFLSPKKILDGDVFKKVANDLAHSPYYFWKWVRSFKDTYNFKSRLATIYPTLSEKIQQNRTYSVALNKNFDLVYHLACVGDTGSLSKLKNTLGNDLFLKCLTEEKENKVSGFSALCHLGKRGIFKLISDLPIEKQRALFLEKNSQGKSALDECRGNFLRMVQENIFNQTYQKEPSESEKQEPVQKIIIEEKKDPSPNEEQEEALFPRKKLSLTAFDKDIEDYKTTNPELYQEVQGIMNKLAKMSKKRMQIELKEGIKNHRKLSQAPCIVKNIRGNDYRLGYRVFGDSDKNQGKIVFLFFWTHEQYNKKLNNDNTVALVKQAIELAKNDTSPVPPVPLPNPGNGGR